MTAFAHAKDRKYGVCFCLSGILFSFSSFHFLHHHFLAYFAYETFFSAIKHNNTEAISHHTLFWSLVGQIFRSHFYARLELMPNLMNFQFDMETTKKAFFSFLLSQSLKHRMELCHAGISLN